MSAEELVRNGELEAALAALKQDVRGDPANPKLRVFLFQLLCVQGQWDRAITQLNVAADMDPETKLMANVCRRLLNCEALRAEVFSGKRAPLVFGEPAAWVGHLVQAAALLADGHGDAAAKLRDEAFAAAPAIPGFLNGEPFAWIADADSRLGPVLEAVIEGRYYWIPFSNIRAVTIDPPGDLRDVVWVSASFLWANEGQSVGFIPTRYPFIPGKTWDAALLLSRRTEWWPAAGDAYIGAGQRMLATDTGEFPVLEVREIRFQAD